MIFDHKLSLRSYLETGILSELTKIFELKICTIGNLDYNLELENVIFKRLNVIGLSLIENFILGFYANCYWWSVANKSLSIQNKTWYRKNNKWDFTKANKLAEIYSKLFSNPPIRLSVYFLRGSLHKIANLIDKENETKILYITSGGTSSISDQLVSFFSKQDLGVYCIVENWDNISSKAVFAHPAKMTGVWGDQSKKFATRIHNIKDIQVLQIGNPRVEWLQKNVRKVDSPRDIFFGGGSVDFLQESIFLLSTLEIAKKFQARVFYLPHPKCYNLAREFVKSISSKNLFCIGNFQNKDSKEILPNLNTYLYPFNNAKIFISSFSTLNLEAAVIGIPSIAIDLRTDIQVAENRISDRHDHIKDILGSDIFQIAHNIHDFKTLVSDLFRTSESRMKSDSNELSYLINLNNTYIERLKFFLNS